MNESLGKNILDLRKIHNMSQEELANILQVSRQSISKWERGESYPDIENLAKLAKIFNVAIDDLVNTEFTVEDVEPVKQLPGQNVDQNLIKISILGITIIEMIQYIIVIIGIASFNGILSNFDFTGAVGPINIPLRYISTAVFIQAIAFTFINLYFYFSIKKNHVTEYIRYTFIGYGIIRVLLGSTLIGLLIVAIGWFTLVNSKAILKKVSTLLLIIFLAIAPYLFTYYIVKSISPKPLIDDIMNHPIDFDKVEVK